MKKTKLTQPVSCWSEKDLLDGKVVDAFVTILRTVGCSWQKKGGCYMCGYSIDSDPHIEDSEVLAQLDYAIEKMKGEPIFKLYTSGSFFDNKEISKGLRQNILEKLKDRIELLVIESRPKYINADEIKNVQKYVKNLEVAIGLESANERVLRQCINKGIVLEDYITGASVAKDAGATIRTYLLIKPPYLTEREAIDDAINSAKIAAKFSDTISFNPVNVQRGTLVEKLWRQNQYRPPWLWSVLDVLEMSKDMGARVVSQPSGGGTPRGAHNCDSCDVDILKALDEFSIGSRNSFDDLDCTCKDQWLDILELESVFRSSGDIHKILGL
jgi:radical SAM enzyme (TIGR01210 family)